MKREIAMQWAEALESGKYEQGKSALQRGDAYCCLGVLCAIVPEGVAKRTVNCYGETCYDGDSAGLPRSIMKWSGLKDSLGLVTFKKGPLSLANLNDSRNRSFKRIAKYIRRNWERL